MLMAKAQPAGHNHVKQLQLHCACCVLAQSYTVISTPSALTRHEICVTNKNFASLQHQSAYLDVATHACDLSPSCDQEDQYRKAQQTHEQAPAH